MTAATDGRWCTDGTVGPRAAAAACWACVPVVLRPAVSTVWLWVLAVVVLTARRLGCSRPGRAAAAMTPPPDRRRSGSASPPRRRWSRPTARRRALRALGARRVAADAPGASDNRHRIRLGPASAPCSRTPLLPRRRGDLRAVGVTVRVPRTARARRRARRTRHVPGTVRGAAPLRLPQAPPVAGWPGCGTSTAGRRCGCAAQGTEFDSLREYVRGDDVRSIDWRASGPDPQRRRAHLAARARPAGGAGARHLPHLGRPRRRRAAARLRDGRRPAAGRARRPGRRPGRLRRRRPPGPQPAAASTGGRGRRRTTCRTRWPTSSR